MPLLSPVAPRERVLTLDVLRGFALFGVLVCNVYGLYSARAWEKRPDTTRLDSVAHWFLTLFVEGKAQTLLTLLFGYGFAVQLLRAEARDQPMLALYVRRLLVLLLIGGLHVLLWWGDVTWTYAITGFGLLAFHRASNRTRVLWALALIFVAYAIGRLPSVSAAGVNFLGPVADYKQATAIASAAIHGHRFWSVPPAHLRLAVAWSAPIYLWYFPQTLGRFLLGYVVGKQRWFDQEGALRLPLFRKLVCYGFLVHLPFAIFLILLLADLVPHRPLGWAIMLIIRFCTQLGLLGITAAYVGIVVLLMQRPLWRQRMALLAPVGRMSLSTYISQSLICTFLFYGWGLGWAGKVGSAACMGVAFGVFALQVIGCHLWLRWFRFGPLEWVWRSLVYLKQPAMRIAQNRTCDR